jgi:hypothetical protein
MKPIRFLCCVVVAASSVIHAEDPPPATLEEIITKRDELLSKLLDSAKAGLKSGKSDCTEVYTAMVDLYSFRRDSAKNIEDKRKWQKELVAKAQEYATDCKKRVSVGVMTQNDHLRATERALAAQQLLLELEAAK